MTLRIQNLTVAYGKSVVLQDLDLEIRAGERFAIMGPSGSGKSSLLRAIAGITASTGSVALNGTDLTGLQPHQRSIGLMFQDFALFPHMSVADNVAFGLRMRGVDREERRRQAAQALASVGLEGFETRDPMSLSGGEQQRVALARTLVTDPDLLMLDEPLGSLDLSLRDSLLDEMRSIIDAQAVTTIYVTHDRFEAFAFADRLAVILDGSIAAIGTPTSVWHDPGTVTVARLIGHPNVVEVNPWFDNAVSIPSEAILLDATHNLEEDDTPRLWSAAGTVASSTFADGRFATTVAVNGLPQGIVTDTPSALEVGSAVMVRIDTEELIPLSGPTGQSRS